MMPCLFAFAACCHFDFRHISFHFRHAALLFIDMTSAMMPLRHSLFRYYRLILMPFSLPARHYLLFDAVIFITLFMPLDAIIFIISRHFDAVFRLILF